LLALLLTALLAVSVQAEDAPAAASGADAATPAGPAKYIYMEPAFVVNYGSTGRMRYLRTEVVLRVSSVEAAARVSQHKPYLRNNLVIDRKSTRLNSSHVKSSYAVFCLNKQNETTPPTREEAEG